MNARYAIQELFRFNGPKGRCPDDASSLKRLNQARRLIYDRGIDAHAVMAWCVVKPDGAGRYILPAEMASIKSGYIVGHDVDMQGFNSLLVPKSVIEGCGCKPVTLREMARRKPYGVVPPIKPMTFGVMALSEADNGKSVSVRGWINGRGAYVLKNETLKLKAGEIVETESSFQDLESVSKPVTDGDVLAYAVGIKGECLIAQYARAYMRPSYIYVSPQPKQPPGRQIAFFGRKTYLDILDLDEEVDIGSIEALKHAYKALNASETNNTTDYANAIQLTENALDKADAGLDSGGSETGNIQYDLQDSIYRP